VALRRLRSSESIPGRFEQGLRQKGRKVVRAAQGGRPAIAGGGHGVVIAEGDGTSGSRVGPFTIFPDIPEAPLPPQSDTTIPPARATAPVTPLATATITRTVTVAAGVFAPGHLGELTRYLPFELVDDVLAQTHTVQRRLRALPSRTGVYFMLALGLFPQIGYLRVWAKLCAGLAGGAGCGVVVPVVTEKALRELRRRLGPAPLQALFEIVAGPLAQHRTPGVCFAGMRTVAFDGLNSIKVPDTDRNRGWLGRIRYPLAFAGYPAVWVMCLVETGTRGLLGAVIGGAIGHAGDRDETHLARRLLGLLGPGMLLLGDRAYDSGEFLAAVNRTGSKLLVRGGATRKPPVLRHLPDGSYLSEVAGLAVRIIEADLAMRGADGTTVHDTYRLDHHPARRSPLPGDGADPALPRTLGDRVRVPRAAPHPARRACAALR
jgi:hypothetical protein